MARLLSIWRTGGDDALARGERGVDEAWYLAMYPDVAAAGADPVRHYLDCGWCEGREPRPDFSTRSYLAAHENVSWDGLNPFIHYLRDDELARGERGLDHDWYLATYPDVAAADVDPVRHYLVSGWREGRDPRPDFSTRAYLAAHEDVAQTGLNPFIHFLQIGCVERGGVDRAWYLAKYPDVAAAGVDPVRHYLDCGWREGRDPRSDFSTRGYLAIHRDIAEAGRNPFVHYLRHGGPKGPIRDLAFSSWQSLWGRFGRTMRAAEWWDYKLVPIVSMFYATALAERMAVASMWQNLLALICAIVPCAAYASLVNDVTDRADDRRAGKTNRLADEPLWLLGLLLAAPLCIGAAFSFTWRKDAPLVAAYLCTWVAFTLYSSPPFRLKSRGVLGVVADASGAHLFPALVAALLAFGATGAPFDPIWLGAIAAWAFGYGLRGILWHQIHDRDYDRRAGVGTFVLRHSPRTASRLAAGVAVPLESIGLAVLLWRMHSLLPLGLLLLYAAHAALRQKLWAIPVVIAAPRERCSVLGQEYYGVLLPLGILISSALRHPIDGAIILAHLLMFPGPAFWFAMQSWWMARDILRSIKRNVVRCKARYSRAVSPQDLLRSSLNKLTI